MKKMTAMLMIAAFLAVPASMSFAAEGAAKKEAAMAKADVVKGEIVSLDAVKGEVVVKDEAGDKTFTATAAELEGLKAGDKVKVTLKAGTTTVESIKKQGKKKSHKSK
ncbi:MAG: hypothetical protein HQL22_04740 [Candidatus Omnitrophica bacterium]|nr:hypothetical protein [Candidatus Omnitrophota bacterium]